MTSNYFSYDKKQVLQALRYHFITRKEIRIMMILVNLFAIVSVIFYFSHKIQPLTFLVSSILWFVVMIAFWFLLPNIIFRKAETFKDHFRVLLQDQHLFLENERGSKSWPWSVFKTLLESPYFFHLYFDSRSFFLIPKDAFNGDDLHEARKIFKAKIPD